MNALEFIGACALVLIGIKVLSGTPQPKMPNGPDDTDPPGGRSGLVLFTDSLTGVQYVATPLGGITPRLNADGTVRVIGTREGGQ